MSEDYPEKELNLGLPFLHLESAFKSLLVLVLAPHCPGTEDGTKADS